MEGVVKCPTGRDTSYFLKITRALYDHVSCKMPIFQYLTTYMTVSDEGTTFFSVEQISLIFYHIKCVSVNSKTFPAHIVSYVYLLKKHVIVMKKTFIYSCGLWYIGVYVRLFMLSIFHMNNPKKTIKKISLRTL